MKGRAIRNTLPSTLARSHVTFENFAHAGISTPTLPTIAT
jgi:hypothetical protein